MKLFGLMSILAICFAFVPHPLHLTVAEAHWKKESKSLEVSVKLFYDDFENALEEENQKPMYLCPDSLNTQREFIESYFRKEFKLNINEKLADFKMVGYECEDELVYVYLEYNNISKIKSLEINNTLLFESFLDQTNLLHLHINEISKTLLTEPKTPSSQVKFQ